MSELHITYRATVPGLAPIPSNGNITKHDGAFSSPTGWLALARRRGGLL